MAQTKTAGQTAHVTTSPEQTKALGRKAAANLRGGDVILLFGELGTGKTMFAQGVAEGLGIAEPVKSPTFVYLREYEIPGKRLRFRHFDLYRLADKAKNSELDTIEFKADPNAITVVEWPEKLTLPQIKQRIDFFGRLDVQLEIDSDSSRSIDMDVRLESAEQQSTQPISDATYDKFQPQLQKLIDETESLAGDIGWGNSNDEMQFISGIVRGANAALTSAQRALEEGAGA